MAESFFSLTLPEFYHPKLIYQVRLGLTDKLLSNISLQLDRILFTHFGSPRDYILYKDRDSYHDRDRERSIQTSAA